MKHLFISMMLVILAATSFSQETTSTIPLTKQGYLLKSKHQKTAAWIMMGGGIVLSTTGFAIAASAAGFQFLKFFFTGQTPEGSSAGSVLFFSGCASMAGSIPLFIAGAKNKRKGMSLSFKNQQVSLPQTTGFVYKVVPSINLKISL